MSAGVAHSDTNELGKWKCVDDTGHPTVKELNYRSTIDPNLWSSPHNESLRWLSVTNEMCVSHEHKTTAPIPHHYWMANGLRNFDVFLAKCTCTLISTHDNFFVRWAFLSLLFHQFWHNRERTFHRNTRHAKTNGLRNRNATLATYVVNARYGTQEQGKACTHTPLLDLLWFEIHTLANSHETKKIDTLWARKSLD